MDRSQLESLYELLPNIIEVDVYARGKSGIYDYTQPYRFTAAEKRPIEVNDERLFEGVSGNVERCLWHLWVNTSTAHWDTGFMPRNLRLENQWLLKDPCGKEWSILDCKLEMIETRWRCPCVEVLGDPIIKAS